MRPMSDAELEGLIRDLNAKIEKLEAEKAELEEHVNDFERIAHVWKDGHRDEVRSLKIQLANAKAVIESYESAARDDTD